MVKYVTMYLLIVINCICYRGMNMKKFTIIFIMIICFSMILVGCNNEPNEEAKGVATQAFDALKNKEYEKYYSYFSKESIELLEETKESLSERLKNEQGSGGINISEINILSVSDYSNEIKIISYETKYVDNSKQEKSMKGEIALKKQGSKYKILYEGLISGTDYEEKMQVLNSGEYRVSLFKTIDAIGGKHVYYHVENNRDKALDFGSGANVAKFTMTTTEGVYTCELKAKYKPEEDTIVNTFFKDSKGELLRLEVEGIYATNEPVSIILYDKEKSKEKDK